MPLTGRTKGFKMILMHHSFYQRNSSTYNSAQKSFEKKNHRKDKLKRFWHTKVLFRVVIAFIEVVRYLSN